MLKFEITQELKDKFKVALENELIKPITNVNIEDHGDEYEFRFTDDVSSWHMELDKRPTYGAWYILHCSNQKLDLPLRYITNIKLFCQQIARIKKMQSDYVDGKKTN